MTGIVQRLQKLPTAVLSDVLAAMGLSEQVLRSDIRSIAGGASFAGPALCLRGTEGPEPDIKPRPIYEADRRMFAGCVAVIATGEHRLGAVIGGNVAIAWKRHGCAGVLTDGGIRDAEEIGALMPVFGVFVGPMSNKGLWAFHEIDVLIALPGQRGRPVSVRPRDIVVADRDGAVIVPAVHAEEVGRAAEITDAVEAQIRADLARGADRETTYGRYDRLGHIRRLQA